MSSPKPIVVLGAIAAVVIAATLGVLTVANNANRISTPTVAGETLIRSDSPTMGNLSAKVTLVEFLDPECEACGAIHPLVKELKFKYQKDMRFVVRYMPLHGNSVLAASAMEAAGEQGKYWEYMDIVYRAQSEWAPPHDGSPPKILARDAFIQYAGYLNLDKAAFIKSMDDPKHAVKITRDRTDAIAAGVQATPTFFLNGTKLEVRTRDDLEAAIVRAIAANK
jgi:protein-disulfide isomerase